MEENEKLILQKRCVPVEGIIDEKMFDNVRKYIFQLYDIDQQEPITLIVNSQGGLAFYGFALYDFLKGFPGDIHALVHGCCFSTAVTVILGCKSEYRAATEHSRFLIHDGYYESKISMSENIAKQQLVIKNEATYWRKKLRKVLTRETNLEGKNLQHFLRNSDRYSIAIVSEEAKKYNIISKIWQPGEKLPFF